MAGQSGKRSPTPQSASQRSSHGTASGGAASPFALVPLGKHEGKPAIPLTRPVLVIGSRSSSRIHLNSSSVSQSHALLVRNGGTYYIHDLASRTHVFVSGQRVRNQDLTDGATLNIGSFTLKFTGPAAAPAPAAPEAILLTAGQAKPKAISQRVFLIGRRPGSDVLLADAAVSTSHAVIFEMNGYHVVRDLGSRTGTWVNGVQVHQHVLSPGDRIKIGPTTFNYQAAAAVPHIDTLADDPVSAPQATSADDLDAMIAGVIASGSETAAPEPAAPLAATPMPAASESIAPRPAMPAPADAADDDFGLDFLLPDAAEHAPPASVAKARGDAVIPLHADLDPLPMADDPATEIPPATARRGWHAVVPEPIEPAPSTEPAPATESATEYATESEALPNNEPLNAASSDAATSDAVTFDAAAIEPHEFANDDHLTFAGDETAGDAKHPTIEPFDLSGMSFETRSTESEAASDELAPLDFADPNAEAERVAAEKAAAEQAEAERLEAERLEAERVEAERVEAERGEAERVERERVEAERIESERVERERVEAERIESERIERERVEAERVEAERNERERVEAERIAAEKAAEQTAVEEAERQRLEAERVAAEEAERDRIETERIAAETAERNRVEAERVAAEEAAAAERQRIEAERIETERLEALRIEAERVEAERVEAERIEAERVEAERIEVERVAAERLEAERAEAERVESERLEAERVEAERVASESAAAEANLKLQAERLAAEALREANEESILEIIAPTEPSPESALGFELEVGEAEHASELTVDFDPEEMALADDLSVDDLSGDDAAAVETPAADLISDSAFGRAVDDFTGELSGAIVETDATSSDGGGPIGEMAIDEAIGNAEAPLISAATDQPVESSINVSLDLNATIRADVEDSIEPATAGASSTLEQNAVIAPSSEINLFDEPIVPLEELGGDAIELADSHVVEQHTVEHQTNQPLATVDPPGVSDEFEIETFDLDELIKPSDDLAPPQLDLSKLAAPATPPAPDPLAGLSTSDDSDWEPLPIDDELPPGPIIEAEAPSEPVDEPPQQVNSPTRHSPTAEERGKFWGNEATVLGGLPLLLPQERAAPLFADGRPLQPAPGTEAPEDVHIDAVSQMIGELLDEAVAPGTPKTSTAQPPAPPSDAVSDAPPAPNKTRRPLKGRTKTEPVAETVGDAPSELLRIDEQIPPYGTALPGAGAANGKVAGRREDAAADLQSLSRPPVHETDVFAHGSAPSSDLTDEFGAAETLADDPLAPQGRGRVLPVAPMDLLGDVAGPTNGNGRRLRNGSRPPAAPTIGRIDLPNDPFWSGAAPAAKLPARSPASNGKLRRNINGNGDVPHTEADAIGAAGDESLSDIAGRLEGRANKPLRTRGNRSGPQRHGAARPVVTYATDVDPDVVHLVRRRRFRRVGALLLGGTALAIGAFAACWKFIPVHSQVEANVHYAHLADTTEAERRQFAAGQSAILQNPGTRIAAVHAKPPELPGGFLDDPAAYSRIIEGVSWPTAQHDVLCINIQSTEPEADFIRVKALAQALYDANGVLIDDANRNRGRLADASDLLNNALRQAAELKKNIDASRAAADAWPSPETMATLTANVDRLEKAWKDAKVAEKNAQAEIERLKAASSSAVSTTQPAAAIAGTPDANVPDANIGQMQADLAAAQSKLAEAKATHDREAVQARAELDAALGQFQQQVAAAKELSRDNPELASYVTAAQKLQETTHKLVDDLINRQQQNYTRLTDLQARLGEKMQTRRKEMWQSDEKLKNLNDELEYAKRTYNTAIGTGDAKSAADLKAQIELLQSMVHARQELLPDDPFYSAAVDDLQKIVDQTRQQMKEDRQRSDEALDTLQKTFANSQPAVDKLPAQQKNLAADMEKRLADINAARAKFNDLATGATTDDATRKLQDQTAQLAASIEARKKQLADQSVTAQRGEADARRKADLAAHEAELPKLTQAVNDSESAFMAASAQLQDAKHAIETARAAMERSTVLTQQQMELGHQLDQYKVDVNAAQEAVRTSIEPVLIADNQIFIRRGQDNRMMYGSIASLSILAIAGILILMTIHAANQELPLNAMDPTDDGVDPFWQATAEMNGHTPEPVEPFPGANEAASEADKEAAVL